MNSITLAVCLAVLAAVASYTMANDIPPLCASASVTPVSCEGADDGDALRPHPDECRLFYYCVGATPVCRQCPAGLHFNPELHVCDLPDHAGCQQD